MQAYERRYGIGGFSAWDSVPLEEKERMLKEAWAVIQDPLRRQRPGHAQGVVFQCAVAGYVAATGVVE